MLAGVIVGFWLLPGPRHIGPSSSTCIRSSTHPRRSSSGFQSISFAFFTKIFAISEGLLPPDAKLEHAFKHITLEGGLVCGAILILAGIAGTVYAVAFWGAIFRQS